MCIRDSICHACVCAVVWAQGQTTTALACAVLYLWRALQLSVQLLYAMEQSEDKLPVDVRLDITDIRVTDSLDQHDTKDRLSYSIMPQPSHIYIDIGCCKQYQPNTLTTTTAHTPSCSDRSTRNETPRAVSYTHLTLPTILLV